MDVQSVDRVSVLDRVKRSAASLVKRVRGAAVLSGVAGVATGLFGTAVELIILFVNGGSTSAPAVVNRLLSYAVVGAALGLLSSVGILLASRKEIAGSLRTFLVASGVTAVLYLGTIFVAAGPGVQIVWGTTLSLALGVSFIVGAIAAVLVRVASSKPNDDDAGSDVTGAGS